MSDVELRFPPDAEFVGLARLVVTAAARQAGVAEERVEDLKIAVSEAATNAMRTHARERTPEPVVLSFGTGRGTFSVAISNFGADLEPLPGDRRWEPDPEQLGLQVIGELADTVTYDRTSGLRLEMSFDITAASEVSDSPAL
jgi:serine/threonine-protein kinase RsbW